MKVTLGIPTYERLAYLKEAVCSAQMQTYKNVEVLISDDGSSPEIRQWCEEMSQKDSRIRYIKNERRRGLAGNWNSILENAAGDYVGIIGDDDRYLPDFVERLMEGIQKGADVVFSSHYWINPQGERLEQETLQNESRYHRREMNLGFLENPPYWIWRNSLPMSSALFRHPGKNLRFDESLNTPEILFYLQLARSGKSFFFIADFLLEFRVHPDSSTASGLWTERLTERLMDFEVEGRHEELKKKMISSMIINAVGRSLTLGEAALAAKLISSSYYDEAVAGPGTKWLQCFCECLPLSIGSTLYKAIHRWKNINRKRSRKSR